MYSTVKKTLLSGLLQTRSCQLRNCPYHACNPRHL